MKAQIADISVFNAILGVNAESINSARQTKEPSQIVKKNDLRPRRVVPHRTKVTPEQREEVLSTIRKKILEGKFAQKLIYAELLAEGIISDDTSVNDPPCLKSSLIAIYIKQQRRKMNVEIPLAKFRINRLYKKLLEDEMKYAKRPEIIRFISSEIGCGKEWVREILSLHEDKNEPASTRPV